MYDKLVTKVNNIDIRGSVLKTKSDTDKSDLEIKISDTEKKFLIQVDLLKETHLNSKVSEIESKAFTLFRTKIKILL